MGKDLELPYRNEKPDWDSLYRARGDEVSLARPIFTGDVFAGLRLPGRTGSVKSRSVMVVQHPCSMRADGVALSWQILVAEVSNRRLLSEPEWQGNVNLMPLPELMPDQTSQARHQAADFDALYTVSPDLLVNRVACLSPFGVNLHLQRWVHYNSRVVVPTIDFQEQSSAFYEEADLIEEWCDSLSSGDINAATAACVEWLRQPLNGSTPQEQLKDPQARSTIRRAMREEIKRRHAT